MPSTAVNVGSCRLLHKTITCYEWNESISPTGKPQTYISQICDKSLYLHTIKKSIKTINKRASTISHPKLRSRNNICTIQAIGNLWNLRSYQEIFIYVVDLIYFHLFYFSPFHNFGSSLQQNFLTRYFLSFFFRFISFLYVSRFCIKFASIYQAVGLRPL